MSKRPNFPQNKAAFAKIRARFKQWLVANGSEIMPLTNEYELVRFRTTAGIGIIYCDRSDTVSSYQNGAKEAMHAFLIGAEWRAVPKGKRLNKTARLMLAIQARDGTGCFYCQRDLTLADATLEHLVAITHGGPSHMSNYALACQPCNAEAGHLAVTEKLELAIRNRAANPL